LQVDRDALRTIVVCQTVLIVKYFMTLVAEARAKFLVGSRTAED